MREVMRTETRLAKYQERLKNAPRPRRFSPGAFVFNSFYYLFAGMPGWFALYFFGGLFLMTAGFVLTRSLWVVPAVMAASRIVGALTCITATCAHSLKETRTSITANR